MFVVSVSWAQIPHVMCSMLFRKDRVKPFVRDRQTQSPKSRHTCTEHMEEKVSHTQTDTGIDRFTASGQTQMQTNTLDRQGMEVSRSMTREFRSGFPLG